MTEQTDEQAAFETLVRGLWDQKAYAARCRQDAAEADLLVGQIEARVIATIQASGAKSLYAANVKCRYSVVRRQDVRVTDAEEFAAAMRENGMEPPMTEPKLDTRAMKELAKRLPDWPGSEPFETVYLQAKGDQA